MGPYEGYVAAGDRWEERAAAQGIMEKDYVTSVAQWTERDAEVLAVVRGKMVAYAAMATMYYAKAQAHAAAPAAPVLRIDPGVPNGTSIVDTTRHHRAQPVTQRVFSGESDRRWSCCDKPVGNTEDSEVFNAPPPGFNDNSIALSRVRYEGKV